MIDYKTVSLSDQVYEHLETDILSGKYKRGEVVTELQLCTELGVSRTPVREALRRLFQEHLVEDTPKGTMILGITPKDFRDMSEIRLRIEDLALRGFVANASDDAIKELKEAVDFQEFYLSRGDLEHIRALDGRFHDIIYSNCDSVVLHDTLSRLHRKIQQYRRVALHTTERASQSVSEHRAILNAIIARDADRAVECVTTHIKNAIHRALDNEEV